jgi:hypothetical protein
LTELSALHAHHVRQLVDCPATILPQRRQLAADRPCAAAVALVVMEDVDAVSVDRYCSENISPAVGLEAAITQRGVP